MKSYIHTENIKQCRNWFRTRFGLQEFAGNYSHSKKYAKTNWMCRCGSEREEEGHIIRGHCEVYGDLRSQFGDLKEDNNLVQYFQAVLDRRDSLEEEDTLYGCSALKYILWDIIKSQNGLLNHDAGDLEM
jgi:hypothetical protein